MLNSEGRVYTTGSNSMGQLGHSQTDSIATPVGLESKRIAWIGGGEYFSLAIDTEGVGYGWGAGYVRASDFCRVSPNLRLLTSTGSTRT